MGGTTSGMDMLLQILVPCLIGYGAVVLWFGWVLYPPPARYARTRPAQRAVAALPVGTGSSAEGWDGSELTEAVSRPDYDFTQAGAENWGEELAGMTLAMDQQKSRWTEAALKEPTGEINLRELWDDLGLQVVSDPFLGDLELGEPEDAVLFAETGRDWMESWMPAGLLLPGEEVIDDFVNRWAIAPPYAAIGS